MSDPCYQVIADLEQHNLRTNKEQIIAAQAEFGNTEFFEGCRLALDSMITFGLKQIPEKKDEDGPGLSWAGFTSVVERLRNRQLTGNVARGAVDILMNTATQEEWNGWYRRILIKDLRCGVSEKTINKVVSKINANYAVPVFSCQLAHDSANHESKVKGKKYIEVKLDGVRVITIVHTTGLVEMFSRNGKELVNFPHICDQISAVVKSDPPPYPIVLDGEVMSSSFQDLMKQVHRKSDVQSNDAVLHLFDFLPLENFEQGGWDKDQEARSHLLYHWHKKHKDSLANVAVVGHELVDLDTAAGKARFKEINKKAIEIDPATGKPCYEGIMVKEPNAPYECKRTASWLKLKPYIEVSLTILAVEEGTGKNVGRLGAFVCGGNDGGFDIVSNVGSGFSDDDRISFWAAREEIVGDIAEIRADAITQNQDGTYSLRFPRFRTFRGFKHGEKI